MKDWRELIPDANSGNASFMGKQLSDRLLAFQSAVQRASDKEIDDLVGVAAMHELPWVRHSLLQSLASRAPDHPEVRSLVAWLTHDYEDFVAFEAIRLAGLLRIREVLADLFVIVGRASERVQGAAGKPVGLGHAVVLRAITAIIGSDERSDIVRIEEQLFPEGTEDSEYPAQPSRDADKIGDHSHRDMVPVPGGRVRGGPPPSFDRSKLLFDWDDPEIIGECRDFRIDTLPVSNTEYDAFAFSPAADDHLYCHPAEPKKKLHLRNTLLDPRSGPDHPVTGVDWFDAYAYARSRGKRLPTEAEWQRAGEGDDRRAWPWGQVFDISRTFCHPLPREAGWDGIRGWRDELLRLADEPPKATSRPRGIAGSESPYGVRDLSGNVWEWTASSFDGPPFSPVGTGRDALEVIYDQRSYAVIKGGTWSSLPEQTSVAFRGRDLALDRHFEIGFRCACDCV